MITASHLTKSFGGTRALDDVNLTIGRGECLAIVGSRGSGQTTLLRVMAALMPPTSGRIDINGLDIAADPFRARRLMAYAGHERIEGHRLRVGEYLRSVASVRGRPAASVEAAAALVGLDARAPIATLAAGAQPRVALAAALVAAPDVLLLDRPFRTLAVDAHEGFCRWLASARDRGSAIVVSASTVEETGDACRRVARLDGGRIVEIIVPSRSSAGQPAALAGA